MRPGIVLALVGASAHNWIFNPRSRAGGRASTNRPGPPRPTDRDPHITVGPGQEFLIEWSTGHPNSQFYFTVLHSSDEAHINDHTPELLDDYIANAPANASETFNSSTGAPAHEPGGIWRKWHLSCSHAYGTGDDGCDGCKNCGQGHLSYNDGSDYDRVLTADDALYVERPAAFADDNDDGDHGMTPFAFPEAAHAEDTRVAYRSAKYPWIESVSRFAVWSKWAQESDTARFTVPARKGSGEYLVHMYWRGYYDVIDVDVLEEAAADVYGRVSNKTRFTKQEHCQFEAGTYDVATHKYWKAGTCFLLNAALHGAADASACMARCEAVGWSKCAALNVVPLRHPPAVPAYLRALAPVNIPFDARHSTDVLTTCDPSIMESYVDAAAYARNDTLVCYPIEPNGDMPPSLAASASADDFGYEGTVIDSDPEDPIFYSTCYRRQTSWEFVGNAPCPACETVVTRDDRWHFGDRCISCDDVLENGALSSKEVAWWELSDTCENCDAAA